MTKRTYMINPMTGKRKWPTKKDYAELSRQKKLVPTGDEKLFTKDEWCDSSEIDNEMKVLTSKFIHEGFERILKLHKPVQQTAFLSMCCSSRPYDEGLKWKRFISEFNGKVDMIVSSNGGLIPREFWSSWPYMNYESGEPHGKKETELYNKVGYEWLLRFFKTQSYKYVICNMNPNHRIYDRFPEAFQSLKDNGYIEDYTMIPSIELYKKVKEDGFSGVNGMGEMYPELHKFVLDTMYEQIETYGYDKSNLPKTIFELGE